MHFRVVVVASTNQLQAELDLDDLMLKRELTSLGYMNTLPYNNSKLANSMFAKELGKRLEGTGVTSYSLCPGLVNTKLFDTLTTFQKFANSVNMTFVGLTPEQVSFLNFSNLYVQNVTFETTFYLTISICV